jgi:thiosulfate/3-mercaptopyruvate sulfurtransferase
MTGRNRTLPSILVDVPRTVARAKQPGLVLLHCDGDGSPARFAGEHLPGARYANLLDDLSDRASPYSHTLLPRKALAAAFGRLGVRNDATVVTYDADNGVWAARTSWLLRDLGFEAAVLDGGLRAWVEAGQPVAAGESEVVGAGDLDVPNHGSHRFALRQDVESVVNGNRRAQLEMSGSREQYYGLPAGNGLRPGHIPGSLLVPAAELVRDDGRLFEARELRAAFEGAGVDVERPVITYCGAGIAASLTALALAVLGNEAVAVYDGSLQEWSDDPTLPLVT